MPPWGICGNETTRCSAAGDWRDVAFSLGGAETMRWLRGRRWAGCGLAVREDREGGAPVSLPLPLVLGGGVAMAI